MSKVPFLNAHLSAVRCVFRTTPISPSAAHRLTVFQQLQRTRETTDRKARGHQAHTLGRQIHGVTEECRIDIEKLLFISGFLSE